MGSLRDQSGLREQEAERREQLIRLLFEERCRSSDQDVGLLYLEVCAEVDGMMDQAEPRPAVQEPGHSTVTERIGAAYQRPSQGVEPGRVPRTVGLTRSLTAALARAQQGSGAPLPKPVAQRLGAGLGRELSAVRIHTDAAAAEAAQALEARAFTLGSDVFFAAGLYAPDSADGDRLLAHELAHVVQHADGRLPASGGLTVSGPADSFEREADAMAEAALAGRRVPARARGPSLPQSLPPWSLPPVAPAGAAASTVARQPSPAPAPGVSPPSPPPPGAAAAAAAAEATRDKGEKENQAIGEWGAVAKSTLTCRRTIGKYDSEGAAVAAIRSRGVPGAVNLETGKFVAYFLDTDSLFSFTFENTKIVKRLDATTVNVHGAQGVVTQDGVLLKAGQYANPASVVKSLSPAELLDSDGPFLGYTDAHGQGLQNVVGEEEFLRAFQAAMKDAALDVLKRSEAEAKKKAAQFAGGSGQFTPGELKLMKDTAGELAKLDAEIDAIPKILPYTEAEYQEYAVNHAKFEELKARRRTVLAQYPMLARVDAAAFSKLPEKQMLEQLGGDAQQMLLDIAETRANVIAGDINLWEVMAVVESTIAGLGIQDKQRRDWVKTKAKWEGQKNTIKSVVITVFSIGFGLVAAFATGGLAVAFAAGALGLSAYDAMHSTQQYMVDKAAANTNLDPAQSLVPKDLAGQWAWLVLAWVGVGLDVGTVVQSVRAVSKGAKVAEQAALLAKGNEALLAKLRVAAGNVAEGEVISEATRSAVAGKLGTTVEIKTGIGSEVRVLYEVDSSGRTFARGVHVGPMATVADILRHEETVQLLNRYQGVTGRLRELWERMLSIVGKEARGKNPFPPRTEAFESWLEMEKLPDIIKSRKAELAGANGWLKPDATAALRRDVDFLEAELARHKDVVGRLSLEKGQGFIAKAEESTAEAVKAHYPMPTEHAQYYYYRRTEKAGVYELCTMQDAPGHVPRLTVVEEGGKKVLKEAAPSRAQEAARIVEGLPEAQQAAFRKLAELEADPKVYKVVPLKGMSATERTIGEAMTPAQKSEFIELMTEAFTRRGDPDAAAKAVAAVEGVCSHKISFIHGTDQLRAFDYRRFFQKGGTEAIGDLHHDIPLYLGGDHRRLLDLHPDIHDRLHGLMDTFKFPDGATLAPHDLIKNLPTGPAAAILYKDGRIEFRPL